MKKEAKLVVSVPDGPIQHIQYSWANDWINIWDNGGIGYKGKIQPTKADKADIRKRIIRLKWLLQSRIAALDTAWKLMK